MLWLWVLWFCRFRLFFFFFFFKKVSSHDTWPSHQSSWWRSDARRNRPVSKEWRSQTFSPGFQIPFSFFRLVKGQNHFHESGDIQSSCLSFLHGDSQDLEKDLSSIRVQGSKIDLAWFFRDKHDENAKDQLVLQLAYQGPGPLTGDLYAYSTSQLHFTSKGWKMRVRLLLLIAHLSPFIIFSLSLSFCFAVVCKSLAGTFILDFPFFFVTHFFF